MRILVFIFLILAQSLFAQRVFKQKAFLMGVDFEFAVVAENQAQADQWLQQAISESKRVENLISSWKETSQTGKINQQAGIQAVKVDKELYDLIARSLRISELTQGYFDISFASIDKYWHFDGREVLLPDSSAIQKSVAEINYKNILLNPKEQSVFLKEKGMKIGFGAIGKGYVAEKVKQLWKQQGVQAGLINASGDISCFGNHPETKVWKIAITNPDDTTQSIAWFDLKDSGVVTSGSYQKYVLINHKKYPHIINPKTGWPAEGLKSVSIFCANAELADALATSVFVMGKEAGLFLVNQLKGVEALLIDNENQMIKSKGLKNEYKN